MLVLQLKHKEITKYPGFSFSRTFRGLENQGKKIQALSGRHGNSVISKQHYSWFIPTTLFSGGGGTTTPCVWYLATSFS